MSGRLWLGLAAVALALAACGPKPEAMQAEDYGADFKAGRAFAADRISDFKSKHDDDAAHPDAVSSYVEEGGAFVVGNPYFKLGVRYQEFHHFRYIAANVADFDDLAKSVYDVSLSELKSGAADLHVSPQQLSDMAGGDDEMLRLDQLPYLAK